MAPLDWQAGTACQIHYIQVPSRHQEGISPEGKKKQNKHKFTEEIPPFLIKCTNTKNVSSERLITTKLEGSIVLTCIEEHMGTQSQGSHTF